MRVQIVISHVTGNVNSRHAALALAEAGLLRECHTTLADNVQVSWARVMPPSWRALLARRAFPGPVTPFLRTHPCREFLRQIWRRLGVRWQPRLGEIQAVAQSFDEAVAQSVATGPPPTLVYAYMDAAEQTFLAAKKIGCLTVYELPTPYWRFTRDMVIEEAQRQPEWAMTLPALDENDPVMRRRDRELQLADVILVPSGLVRDSLRLAPPFRGQVRMVPYGCPDPTAQMPVSHVHSSKERPLRILFVGSLNQGKGLGYLAAATEGLEQHAALTVIGSRTSGAACPALDRFLSRHRHLSGLGHDEVLAEMREHDVLVLPTLYEGLALVLLEAMACGMTVITTENSGLEGMITDGQEGFMVPPRDPPSLRARLQLLASDRTRLASMRASAQAWSRQHTWTQYRQHLREAISEFTPAQVVSKINLHDQHDLRSLRSTGN